MFSFAKIFKTSLFPEAILPNIATLICFDFKI
jgi:hypothetical protein